MIGLDRLVSGDPAHRRDPLREGIWRGRVAKAPATTHDPIQVVIPSLSSQHVWGPCAWPERAAGTLPAAGDACVVALTDEGDAWVLAWWPSSYGRI